MRPCGPCRRSIPRGKFPISCRLFPDILLLRRRTCPSRIAIPRSTRTSKKRSPSRSPSSPICAKPFTQAARRLKKPSSGACPSSSTTAPFSATCRHSRRTAASDSGGLKSAPSCVKRASFGEGGASSLGHITSVDSLPPEKKLAGWVAQAAALIESGQERSPVAARTRTVKPAPAALKTPPDFNRALGKNKKAAATFAAFSPSCRREYIEWIVEAKRPETREQRITTAVDWIAEGKQRNWKYQK